MVLPRARTAKALRALGVRLVGVVLPLEAQTAKVLRAPGARAVSMVLPPEVQTAKVLRALSVRVVALRPLVRGANAVRALGVRTTEALRVSGGRMANLRMSGLWTALGGLWTLGGWRSWSMR